MIIFSREHNIFFGIVNSENTMTELLCNFMAFKPFRDAFLKLFLNDEIDISFENFETQFMTDINQSRPDMIISNETCEILIEVKTWNTGLTSNQPDSYIKHLKTTDKQYKYLVFLIPSDYWYISEWDNRIHSWQKDNSLDIFIKTVFWKEIIEIIEKNDLDVISGYFHDFYELLKSWFDDKIISFNSEELDYMYSSKIPEILLELYSIVDDVKGFFSQKYLVSKSMISEEYGIYIRDLENKENLLYFGIWYPFWKEEGFPLCFGVSIDWSKDVVNKFTKKYHNSLTGYEGFKLCTINKEILSDDKKLDKIKELIKDTLES